MTQSEMTEPVPRTGDVLQRFRHWFLDAEFLSRWAYELVAQGSENEDVIYAAANDDLDRGEVRKLFARLCAQLGISEDLEAEAEAATLRVWLGWSIFGSSN